MREGLIRFRTKFKARHVVVIIALSVVLLYLSLFLMTRHHFMVTRWDRSKSDGLYVCPKWLHVYFFSKKPQTNQALYFLFFPIHRWVLSGHSEVEDFENDCEITSVYLFSEEKLEQLPDFWP